MDLVRITIETYTLEQGCRQLALFSGALLEVGYRHVFYFREYNDCNRNQKRLTSRSAITYRFQYGWVANPRTVPAPIPRNDNPTDCVSK